MADEIRIAPGRREGSSTLGLERAIVALAERQHGVVSRSQLLELGLTSSSVGRRVELGRLHPLHQGVYAVGHRVLTRKGRWWAAVLAGDHPPS